MPAVMRFERRSRTRAPFAIKSLEDAHRFVQVVCARSVENHFGVRAWRLARQSAWLLLLVVFFLVYYLIGVAGDALSLL
jgi:hypothetical protein